MIQMKLKNILAFDAPHQHERAKRALEKVAVKGQGVGKDDDANTSEISHSKQLNKYTASNMKIWAK